MKRAEREMSISQGWNDAVAFGTGIELGWTVLVCMVISFDDFLLFPQKTPRRWGVFCGLMDRFLASGIYSCCKRRIRNKEYKSK